MMNLQIISIVASVAATVLGVIVSIALEVVPGIKDKWDTWEYKRAVWLGGSFAVTFGLVGMAYGGAPVFDVELGPFVWDGLLVAIQASTAVYFGGQVAYAAQKRIAAKAVGG